MKTRTQKELGRKEWVLNQILLDNRIKIEDQLTSLDAIAESWINSIYEVSYDEMTNEEIDESIAFITNKII